MEKMREATPLRGGLLSEFAMMMSVASSSTLTVGRLCELRDGGEERDDLLRPGEAAAEDATASATEKRRRGL